MVKFTRKDYRDNKCTHREYYSQFVDESVKMLVLRTIRLDRIKASNDDSFNDIPLKQWDNAGVYLNKNKELKEAGDFITLAGRVCILKEAAKQIKESN